MLAAELGLEGVVSAHNGLAVAADLHRSCSKDGGHIQILLEVGIGTGLLGRAIAPLDEDVAFIRHRSHADRLGRPGDGAGQRLAGVPVGAQRSAAGLIDPVAGLVLHRLLRRRGRFRGGSTFRAAGRCHRRAGTEGVLRPGRDAAGIRAAVLGLIGVGAQIVQQHLQAGGLEVDVAGLVIIGVAVAGGVLEHFGGVQELHPQLFAHGEQRHVEVIDPGLIHVGVVGVVLRHRRHRVHDDVGVGVAGLDGLHQRGVIADEVLGAHAVVVGAQHDDHPAGLHFGHRLRHGVKGVVLFKGHDAVVQGNTGADALLGAELLQGDQAVGVQAHRVGVAEKERLVLISVSRIGGLGQQGAGSLIDLVMVGQIAVIRHRAVRGRRVHRVFSAAEQIQGDPDGKQRGQCTHDAHQHGLLLQGGQ